MPKDKENFYAGLKRVFHEPSRLAIVSALCRETDGLTFNQLKDECDLTFGNLSSHLKTLQDAGIISVEKYFVDNKPRTQITMTDTGRGKFIQYLKALEEVLLDAAAAVSSKDTKIVSSDILGKLAAQQP